MKKSTKKGSQFIPTSRKKSSKKSARPKPKNETAAKEMKTIEKFFLEEIEKFGDGTPLAKIYPSLGEVFEQNKIVQILNQLETKGKIKVTPSGKVHILADMDDLSENNLVTGILDVTRTGAAYLLVDGRKDDIYIPAHAVRRAMNHDYVQVRITKNRKTRSEGEVVKIIQRNRESFIGKLALSERFAFFIPDEKSLRTDFFIPLERLNGAKNHDRVIARVIDWNDSGKNPIAEVSEVIQGENKLDLDMKSILMESGFHSEFPMDTIKELNKIPDEIPKDEIAKRLDLRSVLTITIDPEDAKDFDDAISFRILDNGHYEVGVHIADVSHYLKAGSQLDKEAAKRATSVYLPDRVCPMLPERLSNFLCSLRPHEDKLTFSTLYEMDKDFQVIEHTIAKTVIHSDRRFSYEEAQEVIESGKGDYAKEISTLNRIAKSIRKKRFENGAIAFEKEEVRFKLDDKGMPIGLTLKVRKDAHLMIEDFMLLANETIAKYGSKIKQGKHAFPFVYRVHDKPNEEKLAQFSLMAKRFGYQIRFDNHTQIATTLNTMLEKIQGRPEQNVLEQLAIRSMAKAEYTTKNIGHYGLSIKFYTHFTSPIRRYPDVMVHRLIYDNMCESDFHIQRDELEMQCKNSSLMERKAMDAEREATKYYQVLFLSDKVGNTFKGIITGVIQRGIFVEMTDTKCEGMIPAEDLGYDQFDFDEKALKLKGRKTGKSFQLGDSIEVQVVSVDLEARKINLSLA